MKSVTVKRKRGKESLASESSTDGLFITQKKISKRPLFCSSSKYIHEPAQCFSPLPLFCQPTATKMYSSVPIPSLGFTLLRFRLISYPSGAPFPHENLTHFPRSYPPPSSQYSQIAH